MTSDQEPPHADSEKDLLEAAETSTGWRQGAKRLTLKSTAVLPSFVTVLNGLAGFGAILYATKDGLGLVGPDTVGNLSTAVWLLALAMVFDMLDGRLARMTRRTSDFGGQLDSLCDAVSFGVAPAVLMTRTALITIRLLDLGSPLQLERIVWSIGALYLACTVLRLAKFNVENEPDESAHMDFQGLPSPGAAGVVASLVLLFTYLVEPGAVQPDATIVPDWQHATWFLATVSAVLPAMTLVAALLMVSNVQYAHLVNHWIRGRRPVSYVIKLVAIALALYYNFIVVATFFANLYALSGPALAAWRRFGPKTHHADEADEQPATETET